MQELNLPTFDYKIKQDAKNTKIFDAFRKKYVVLTPEEWVRQHVLHFLINQKNYPASLIAVEKSLKYNSLRKRADALVYDTLGNPLLLIECKATSVKITQDTFNQIALYNMKFKVKYLVVTNGMNHYCCLMDYENETIKYLQDIPTYLQV